MSWVEISIYYSPYLIQFLFLLIFVNKSKYLIGLTDSFGKMTFIMYGLLALLIVYIERISFSYYTNTLLIYYIIQTIVFYYILTINGFNVKDSVGLSFMISFASSFYWEIPIHLMVLFNGEPIFNILIQSMHFATLPFIFNRIVVVDKFKFYKRILYGLVVADILSILSIGIINDYYEYFNMVSRIVCAYMVVTGFLTNIRNKEKF